MPTSNIPQSDIAAYTPIAHNTIEISNYNFAELDASLYSNSSFRKCYSLIDYTFVDLMFNTFNP